MIGRSATAVGSMRASTSTQPTCSPTVVSTSISLPVCWCGARCCTLITPTTRLRAITGAERNASKVSSGSSPKYLEPGVLVSLARNGQQAPLARHPAGQAFVQPQPHLADGGGVRRVGSAQHQLVAVEQVDQAGIALRELHHQRDDALQNFLQAHLPNHEAADLLEQAQLLFGALEACLKLSRFRH